MKTYKQFMEGTDKVRQKHLDKALRHAISTKNIEDKSEYGHEDLKKMYGLHDKEAEHLHSEIKRHMSIMPRKHAKKWKGPVNEAEHLSADHHSIKVGQYQSAATHHLDQAAYALRKGDPEGYGHHITQHHVAMRWMNHYQGKLASHPLEQQKHSTIAHQHDAAVEALHE